MCTRGRTTDLPNSLRGAQSRAEEGGPGLSKSLPMLLEYQLLRSPRVHVAVISLTPGSLRGSRISLPQTGPIQSVASAESHIRPIQPNLIRFAATTPSLIGQEGCTLGLMIGEKFESRTTYMKAAKSTMIKQAVDKVTEGRECCVDLERPPIVAQPTGSSFLR
eukprot:scaffold2351_cov233-Pinguiococcus_pyrenoidosus.AAC.6